MQPRARKYAALLTLCLVAFLPACGETQGIIPQASSVIETSTATLAPASVVTPTSKATTPSPSSAAAPPSPAATAEPSSTPSSLPSVTARPSPTPSPPDQVVVGQTTVSILQYPYEPYLQEGFDSGHGVPYLWLDRASYTAHVESSVEPLVLRYFKAVTMENRYLKLTILPELGGRIYECIFKPTGQNVFYRNQVLKPTPWGPLQRDQNWWLAAGGMEWAFPVHEHGYEWGSSWTYSVDQSGPEVTVTLHDTHEERPRMSVQVSLAPGKAYYVVRPRLENPTGSAITYQYWTNAMLTLGGPSMSPNTEFIYPTQEVIIHSAGPDSGLPGERASAGWPVYEGRDMAWYRNWADWLGLFIPQPTEDFVGAYNHDTGLGIARIFPRLEVPGVKLFAWGQNSPHAFNYADDGSQYFEIWGGPNRTFWPEDDNSLGAGESREWTEYWYPFYHLGGLDVASREAALNLQAEQGSLILGVATTSYQQGTVILMLEEEELHRRKVTISPDSPYVEHIPVAEAPATARVSLRYLGPDGQVLARHDEEMLLH